ncbi:translation initiation factor IF-6 [Ferroplasma acidarmanus]|uniref:Translation initiation factor 6 n=1 Tax=Ferroplasma acidarmanus Fer1 TaxID=333146 RepID=S0AP30_FERAC|nr:translation initiation factor IF-6 [Ferroplasma acidarmanus]AGO61033.1 translation initiation factor IF-6 [Ferroplasma acidarmanus Fer1]
MIKKLSIFESDFIGVYAKVFNDFAFLPRNIPEETRLSIEETLEVKTAGVIVDNFSLIGTMLVFNSNGIVVSGLSSKEDFSGLDLGGRRLVFLKDRLNAIGNNIITSDRAAVIHPSFTESSEKAIADTLGVEVIKTPIAGVSTVGSVAVLNNKGMLVSPEASEEEIKNLSDIFHLPVKTGTANYGSYYIGASILANSSGILVGNATTSIELGRIDDIFS